MIFTWNYFYFIIYNIICRYLAAGMQFRNLACSFRISEIPVAVLVVQGCKAVWREMKKLHVSETRVSYFQRIADGTRGSYDSSVRCVDGEHTRMNCGSTYFCCKNCSSIGRLAVTATNCKLIELCVGSFWTDNDVEVQWCSDAWGEQSQWPPLIEIQNFKINIIIYFILFYFVCVSNLNFWAQKIVLLQ